MVSERQHTTNTLLVTGGAGFIGSNFARCALRSDNASVVVLDKLTYAGHLENLRDLLDDSRLHFVRGDIGDVRLLQTLLGEHRPRAILNFAAETHVDRSIDDSTPFLRTNVLGTVALLSAARDYAASLAPSAREGFRFLHVSTDEVYGSLGTDGRFSESTPYAPNSPYAASKASADHWVRAYAVTYGLPALVTNTSNNYGPYQFPEKLIPLTILNAVEAKPLPLYGDGGHVRDWIYVEDHCEALCLALERGRPGERYHIGAENERSNLQIVDSLCHILDREFPCATNPRARSAGIRSYAELKSFVVDRPGHDRRYAVDSGKCRREFEWRPRTSLAAGLRHTVKWYLEHRSWCEAVQKDNYNRERLGTAARSGGQDQ